MHIYIYVYIYSKSKDAQSRWQQTHWQDTGVSYTLLEPLNGPRRSQYSALDDT